MKQVIDVTTNHADSLLSINLLKNPGINSNIRIYNKSGSLIKQFKVTKLRTSIGIESFVPGLYILIFTSGREVKAVRFVKH